MYSGSCLCGKVTFMVRGPLAPIEICHCRQCQKAQGTPFATNIPVHESAFVLNSGADVLKFYASSLDKKRYFCGQCGAPVYSSRDFVPGILRIRAGLINEAIPVRPARHAYVASKCVWWEIHDDLPRSEQAWS